MICATDQFKLLFIKTIYESSSEKYSEVWFIANLFIELELFNKLFDPVATQHFHSLLDSKIFKIAMLILCVLQQAIQITMSV